MFWQHMIIIDLLGLPIQCLRRTIWLFTRKFSGMFHEIINYVEYGLAEKALRWISFINS